MRCTGFIRGAGGREDPRPAADSASTRDTSFPRAHTYVDVYVPTCISFVRTKTTKRKTHESLECSIKLLFKPLCARGNTHSLVALFIVVVFLRRSSQSSLLWFIALAVMLFQPCLLIIVINGWLAWSVVAAYL